MDWFHDEILDGLTKLMSLSLDRTPAFDMIQMTAATWVEATTMRRVWDRDRDTTRIRAAFRTLALTREAWPMPRHFIDVLPQTKTMALEAPRAVSDSPELRAVMAGADPRAVLGIPPDQPTPENPALAAAERELQRLRSGKDAAGGPDA